MPKSVFLLSPLGSPERLSLVDFVNEDELHSLVEKVPELLDECLVDLHGRWIVVQREMGIPDAIGAPDRWAVDLFLLDSEAVPTFVEVKRSKDPRARREVVAQMLEYAANGSSYWDVADIRRKLQERAAPSLDANADFQDAFNIVTDHDSDTYWRSVESKLKGGQVRLVFVADRIPSELRRLVEFLNEKMPDIQILALEVRQFKVGDRQIAVGEAVGNTMRSRDTKSRQIGTQPVAASFGEWLGEKEFSDPTLPGKLASLFASVETNISTMKLAPTQFTYGVQLPGARLQMVGGTRQSLWLVLASLKKAPDFVSEDARRTLLKELEQIMGRSATAQNLNGYPAFDVTLLSDDARREKFAEFLRNLVNVLINGSALQPITSVPSEAIAQ
jgi:hypothetical protein